MSTDELTMSRMVKGNAATDYYSGPRVLLKKAYVLNNSLVMRAYVQYSAALHLLSLTRRSVPTTMIQMLVVALSFLN